MTRTMTCRYPDLDAAAGVCRRCGTAFWNADDPTVAVEAHYETADDADRLCGGCGADIVGNDPHAPGCEMDPDTYTAVVEAVDGVIEALTELEGAIRTTGIYGALRYGDAHPMLGRAPYALRNLLANLEGKGAGWITDDSFVDAVGLLVDWVEDGGEADE